MQRAALKLGLVTPLGVPGAASRIDYAVMKGGFIKWESRTEDWHQAGNTITNKHLSAKSDRNSEDQVSYKLWPGQFWSLSYFLRQAFYV